MDALYAGPEAVAHLSCPRILMTGDPFPSSISSFAFHFLARGTIKFFQLKMYGSFTSSLQETQLVVDEVVGAVSVVLSYAVVILGL